MNNDFNKGSKYAPLRVWLIAFLGFASLNVFLYAFCIIFLNVREKAFEADNLNTLRELGKNVKNSPDDRHVVVIGSSVIRNALWCSNAFSDYQLSKKNELSRKINIYKIYESGFQLKYFTNQVHLFDSLIEYQPDLVLIEDNMLLTDFKRYGVLSDAYHDYKSALRRGKNILFINQEEKDWCFSADEANKMDSLNISVSFRRAVSLNENLYFQDVLEAGNVREIPIGLLRSPRPLLFKKAVSKSNASIQINKLRNYYLEQYDLHYIPFDQDFHWSDFLDEGHMNKKGQRKYSIWFLNTLEKYFSN